jgi:hypothetical protein
MLFFLAGRRNQSVAATFPGIYHTRKFTTLSWRQHEVQVIPSSTVSAEGTTPSLVISYTNFNAVLMPSRVHGLHTFFHSVRTYHFSLLLFFTDAK